MLELSYLSFAFGAYAMHFLFCNSFQSSAHSLRSFALELTVLEASTC